MLLRDIPPAKLTPKTVTKLNQSSKQRQTTTIERELSPKISPEKKINRRNSVKPHLKVLPTPPPKKPLWLKGLIFLNHSSAFVSYASVTVALLMYGMTVYAPKLWTQKYTQLQELQKKERQFTFTEEMLKDELAQSATNSSSGFVKPNPSKQPIFLPNTPTKAIELKSSTFVKPKVIDSVSPIAY
jgi:hypothetical protein